MRKVIDNQTGVCRPVLDEMGESSLPPIGVTISAGTTEAKIGCNVLNRMTRLGMPVSVRIV